MNDFHFRSAGEADLDALVHLEESIEAGLPNREMFATDGRAFYEPIIGGNGHIIVAEDAEGCLAGAAIIRYPEADDPENLGLSLGLSGKDLAAVYHLESAFIRPDCQGKRLADEMTRRNMRHAHACGYTLAMATAWPGNAPSLTVLFRLGLVIRSFALKYGGRPRFVLADGGPAPDAGAEPVFADALDFEAHQRLLAKNMLGTTLRKTPGREGFPLQPGAAFPPFEIGYCPFL